jgi:hypothetical protein
MQISDFWGWSVDPYAAAEEPGHIGAAPGALGKYADIYGTSLSNEYRFRAPTPEMMQGGAAGVINDIWNSMPPGAAAQALKEMSQKGYFNQFQDFTPEMGNQIGNLIAGGQAAIDGGDFFENAIRGTGVHAGNMLEDFKQNPLAVGPGTSKLFGGDSSDWMGRPSESTNQEMTDKGIGQYGNDFVHTVGPMIGAAAAGAGLANAAGAGSAAGNAGAGSSGTGQTGVSAGAGGEFTGGLNPNITGSPGLNPNITGSPGLAQFGVEGTSLAPGYFPAESLAGPLTYGSSSVAPSLAQTGTQVSPPPASPAMGGLLSNPQLIGAAGGALLGGLSSSGSGTKTGTVTTEEGLPDWLMPYAKPALDQYSTQIQNLNTDPYGIMPSAMKEFKSTIDGMYLDPSTNKYLEDYYKLGAERIKGSLQPSFGHMQAFGAHSGYNEALSRGLGDFATGLYGGNYAKERDRQTSMTASAPQFLAQASTQQTLPYQQYLQSLSSLGKKKEDPFFTNPMGGILGGAMVGSQLGSLWK